MAYVPITALPPAPQRSDSPDDFVSKADAFVAAQDLFVTETNAGGSEINGVGSQTALDVTTTGNNATTSGNNVTYSEEWSVKPEDSLISIAAGGNNSTDYSALHHAAKSSAYATESSGHATNAQVAADAANAAAGFPTMGEKSGYSLFVNSGENGAVWERQQDKSSDWWLAQYFQSKSLTFNATSVSWDLEYKPNAILYLPNDTLFMNAPTNFQDGAVVLLTVQQDGTGGRVITSWDSAYRFGDYGVPQLTTTAGHCDIFSFLTIGTWHLRFLGVTTGIAV